MSIIVRRDDGRKIAVKGYNGSGWSSDGVVLWLGRRQNGDVVEWWGEWSRLRWSFYSSEVWGSSSLGRIVWGSGVDSMLQFWLEKGGDRKKRCRKMMRRQRAHLGSMRRKRDTAWLRDDVDRRRGDTGDGNGRRRRQLGWRKSYWAKKWRKYTRSIQLIQMDSEDLK
jgi:hypothetical protein